MLPVGVVLVVEGTHAHAVDLAAGLLALRHLGFDAHEGQLGALRFGVLRGAEGAGLDEIEEGVAAAAGA